MALKNLFHRANVLGLQQVGRRSQRHQSRQYLLRSQLGFKRYTPEFARPPACINCANYHGIAYGQQRGQRHRLICAIYPHGWTLSNTCPDWQPAPADSYES